MLVDGWLLVCPDSVDEGCSAILPEPSRGVVEVDRGDLGGPIPKEMPSECQGTIGGRVRSKSPASLAEKRLGSGVYSFLE